MAKLRAKLDRYVSVLGSGTALTRIQIIIIKKMLSNTKPITGHAHAQQQQHSLCVCVMGGQVPRVFMTFMLIMLTPQESLSASAETLF